MLADSITGLGFQIAFYYGLTGFACAIYYRKEIFKSVRNFFMVGLAPFAGGAMLTYVFVKAFITYQNPANTTTGKAFLGVGTPVAIGVGMLLLGVVLMIFANFSFRDFFKRKPETAAPGALEGSAPAMAGGSE